MKTVLTTLTIFITLSTLAQDCNCMEEYKWVKETFLKNDAGVPGIIEKKGNEALENNSALIEGKVEDAKTIVECRNTILEWLHFFRKGHIGLYYEVDVSKYFNNDIQGVEYEVKSLDIDIEKFKNEVSRSDKSSDEDIWQDSGYTVGTTKRDGELVGFIIESDNKNWKPKEIKFVVHRDSTVSYYMGNKSKSDLTKAAIIGNNYLMLGDFKFERTNPKLITDRKIALHFEGIKRRLGSGLSHIEVLNDNTLYLQLTKFDLTYKKSIDSIIKSNEKLFLKHENLIVDVRNNPGGGDASFAEIIPYLYTNPIRGVGVEWLATEEAIKTLQKWMVDYPQYKSDYLKRIKLLEDNMGTFVDFDGIKFDVQTLDKILPKPKNVVILINEWVGSSAEQFLLEAKQSRKVKLLGVKTAGALDISNQNSLKSPSGNFSLYYGQSRSYRIPKMSIDDQGIQPDFYMDEAIPEYKWIAYALELLNQLP